MWSQRIILSFLLFMIFLSCVDKDNKEKRTVKNVLFIAIDDLRPELPVYQKSRVEAPIMDNLANSSLIFNNAFCQFSWCSPSRSSLLTGMRPDHIQVTDLSTHFRDTRPEVVTLPQYFKNNGYLTLGYGKIFHNDTSLQDALSWSEPCWLPPVKQPILAYANPANQEIASRHQGKSFPTEKFDGPDNAYPDGQVTEKALAALEKINNSEPFFLAVGFYKPHLPFTAPKKYWDLYKKEDLKFSKPNKPPTDAPPFIFRSWSEPGSYYKASDKEPFNDSLSLELVHGYYACISFIDAQIGKLIDGLKIKGVFENTLIVLWGDHGWKLGEYGRWSKHSNLSLDTRVPFMISHPELKSARKINQVVELIDLYPTLITMAGLPPVNNRPGQDLSILLNDDQAVLKKDFAVSQIEHEGYQGYSLKTKAYRFTEWNNEEGDTHFELYDQKQDSLETRNLALLDRYKPVVDSLKIKLRNIIN